MTPQASTRVRHLIARLRADLAELERALNSDQEDPQPDLVSAKTAELQETCAAKGLAVTADSYVTEKTAAVLLNRSWLTLRNRRKTDAPICWRRVDGRPEYALTDLARYLIERAEDGDAVDL